MGNDPQGEPPITGAPVLSLLQGFYSTATHPAVAILTTREQGLNRVDGSSMVQKSGQPVEVGSVSPLFTGFYTSQVRDFFHQQYFINLDFPEGDFPDFPSSTTFWEPRSCEVARIWSVMMSSSWKFSFWPKKQGICLSQKQKKTYDEI